MSADDVLPPRTAHNVELRHGYTVDQVRGLSIWTVMHDPYHCFADLTNASISAAGTATANRTATPAAMAEHEDYAKAAAASAKPRHSRRAGPGPQPADPGRSAGDRHYGLLACWSSWSVLTARSLWSRGQAEERGEG
jgi:hypothetical protein